MSCSNELFDEYGLGDEDHHRIKRDKRIKIKHSSQHAGKLKRKKQHKQKHTK